MVSSYRIEGQTRTCPDSAKDKRPEARGHGCRTSGGGGTRFGRQTRRSAGARRLQSRGSHRACRAAVGGCHGERSVGLVERESPAAVVNEVMVAEAEGDEVVEIGEPVELPEPDVMDLTPVERCRAAVNG